MSESELGRFRRAFRTLFDLVDEVQAASTWDASQNRYLIEPEVFDNLSEYMADFHDDNEELWNLLSRKQQEG